MLNGNGTPESLDVARSITTTTMQLECLSEFDEAQRMRQFTSLQTSEYVQCPLESGCYAPGASARCTQQS